MRIEHGAAVAGNVLHHRQHAARQQPLAGGATERGDAPGLVAIGAVADDLVGAGDGNVDHRQAVDGDAESRQIVGDEPRAEPHRLRPECSPNAASAAAAGYAGQCGGFRRWTRPPSWSISIGASGRSTACRRLGDERLDLRRRPAVALKENEPERRCGAEELALGGAQFGAGAAEDDGGRLTA